MLWVWTIIGAALATGPAERLAEAQFALERRDPEAAQTVLDTPLPAPWVGHHAALSGAVALQTMRAPDAVQQLQQALDDPNVLPPLRDVTELRLAQALLQIEDYSGANTVLSRLLRPSIAKAGALPQPMGVDPGEVRWLLAQAKQAMADAPGTRKTLQALWTNNPTSQHSASARTRLEEMGYPIDPSTESGQALWVKRMGTLDRLYLTKQSLALREQLPKTHPKMRASEHAEAVFRAKDYARAAALLESLSTLTDEQQVLLALARIRSGDVGGSMTAYTALAKREGKRAETARFKLGYIAWDSGNFSDAIRRLDLYLKQHPSGRHADSALWFKALAQLRLGESRAANRSFTMLENSWPSSSLRPGAAYWKAMTNPNEGERVAGLRRVRETWPTTGYAWFATETLGIAMTGGTTEAAAMPTLEIDSPHWVLGRGLSQAGLQAWSREHFTRIAAQAHQLDRNARTSLANALIEAGAYKSAKKLVKRWCGKPRGQRSASLSEACWPKPSATTVQPLSRGAGLPGHLPFAIMTAESALDPAVTSPAGARGLMQLMPELAETLHPDVFPDLSFHPDRLYAPAYNATLGTTELTRLAEQFGDAGMDNPLPLVIAGYNGGPDAVGRWLNQWTPDEDGSEYWGDPARVDLWSEFIGYSETRKYVRRVLGFLQTYRLVYGDQDAPSTESINGSPGEE